MGDLDIVVENILDEDDDVESEKEQESMDGTESFAKNPTNKISEPFLGEAIALLRVQNTGLESKSKVDTTLNFTAESASYSANSVKLVADPAKCCCSSNKASNTLTADSANSL